MELTAGLVSAHSRETGSTVTTGQIPSVGFNTKMLGYRAWEGNYLERAWHASLIEGAEILTSSAGGWHSCPDATGVEEAIVKEILDNGTTIIMPAGNGPLGTHNICSSIDPTEHTAFFPLSPYYDERIILVSSTGSDDKHQFLSTQNDGTILDVTHSHYNDVDLCSPGYNVMVDNVTNCGGTGWKYAAGAHGTSFAAPIVAGVASLMYSVNDCMVPSICQDILKNTTDPILDAQNYPGKVGTGRVNAYKAVKAAQNTYSSVLDLYIKDRWNDFGKELFPYDGNQVRDESPDIWVRNQPDGFVNQVHEDPEYQGSQSGQSVYVYVRVRNKSCATSTGTEQVELYWSKASSATSWPQNWDGSDPWVGNQIGTKTISTLEPGEDEILEFQWNMSNPYIVQHWATCFMARIAATPTDPITIYPDRADNDVYQNNNIAIRNVNITDIIPQISNPPGVLNLIDDIYYPYGKFIYIGNPNPNPNTPSQVYDFTFETTDGTLPVDAEIKMIFDTPGWNLMQSHIQNDDNFEIIAPRVVRIKSSLAALNDISFPANTRIPVYFGFNFYSQSAAIEYDYKFRVNQYLSSDTSYLGSELYEIHKRSRNSFFADAGSDVELDFGQSTTLNGASISENAFYNWYTMDGTKIGSSQSISVTPTQDTKYKLEVIAEADGSVDYDEVYVNVLNNKIASISPNPATSTVRVDFILDSPNSASIMINNITGTNILDTPIQNTSGYINFDVSNFLTGSYSVVLVCDGIGEHSVTLIVN